MSPTLAGDAVTELARESSTVDLEPVGLALTPAPYVTTTAVLIVLGFASRSASRSSSCPSASPTAELYAGPLRGALLICALTPTACRSSERVAA